METNRLKLIPATVALADAEVAGRDEFARLLGALVRVLLKAGFAPGG